MNRLKSGELNWLEWKIMWWWWEDRVTNERVKEDIYQQHVQKFWKMGRSSWSWPFQTLSKKLEEKIQSSQFPCIQCQLLIYISTNPSVNKIYFCIRHVFMLVSLLINMSGCKTNNNSCWIYQRIQVTSPGDNHILSVIHFKSSHYGQPMNIRSQENLHKWTSIIKSIIHKHACVSSDLKN